MQTNHPWTLSAAQLQSALAVDVDVGLTHAQVEQSRLQHGKNELRQTPPTPLWKLILAQFQDQLVLILLGAALVSFLLALAESDAVHQHHALVEPIVILVILAANATVGVVNESKAELAIEALKSYAPDRARVVRDGSVDVVHTAEIVVGDIIVVSSGDKVPADARIAVITSTTLKLDQSILTGESTSVTKSIDAIPDTEPARSELHNMLFGGTTVTVGKCRAIVTSVGEATALGDIHTRISAHNDEETPLKKRLNEFGDQLAKVISVVCVLVWLVNAPHFAAGGSWMKGAIYYFKIAVALAVAAIPEGLAVVITTCLALGTSKMAKQGAIVRKLPSVETLGCTSIICSDKTGTLTTNMMSVTRVCVVDAAVRVFSVEGTSYGPVGAIQPDLPDTQCVSDLKSCMALCNESRLTHSPEKGFGCIGEPTEAALRTLVEKMEHTKLGGDVMEGNKRIEADWNKVQTFEFSRDRKSMSVLAEAVAGGTRCLFVKGAPESILERCKFVKRGDRVDPMSPALKKEVEAVLEAWATKHALRVLALAIKPDAKVDAKLADPSRFVEFERDLTFVGCVGMLDPPRPEVRSAIQKCHLAGIRVMMITGDNQHTAQAIGGMIGIDGKGMTGKEFAALDKAGQHAAVKTVNVFSRTDPGHKQAIVDLLKEDGWVVAMTGDGVNDAPALKKADIGIAMGSGTDVAKLASDMVLADDNFATIVKAVEEGRSIYANTKQFIRYLISSNIGEVVSIFLTVLLGMPEALVPVQLLWVNLVTDGLPATALGFNPPDNEIMRMPPRDNMEPIVTRWLFIRYCIIGTYVGVATVAGYAWWFMYASNGPHITFSQLTHFHKCDDLFKEIGCDMFSNWQSHRASTMSLSILVVIEMFNAMNSLSENESLLTLPLWNNVWLVLAICLSMLLHFMILYVPFFQTIFHTVPLNFEEWYWVVVISIPVIFLDEGLKWYSRTTVESHKHKKH